MEVLLCGVAVEAGTVVGDGIAGKRFVGIVAGGAGEARVAGNAPAAAFFQAIGGEAHGLNADGAHDANVPQGTVTGSAKVHGLGGRHAGGVDDLYIPGA